MINENIEEFMKNVDYKTKNIYEYNNFEKGISYSLMAQHLLTRVDYLELSKEEVEKYKFEQKIDKKDYKMYDCTKLVPKNTITKRDEDKFTLTETKIKATHIWNVTNNVGIHQTFENKEDAFKLKESINESIYDKIC